MKKIKNIFWIAIGFGVIGYVGYKITMNSFTNHFLGANPFHTKAVIIDEKNYMGNQPVKPEYTYSYQFEFNGKKYTGNSHDRSLKPGDTVEVVYNKDHPAINMPLHPKE
jgi:FtsP/CotA-like multicopper oxidase with cupredoxin domain